MLLFISLLRSRVLEYDRNMIGVDFSPEQIRFFRRLNDFPKLVAEVL